MLDTMNQKTTEIQKLQPHKLEMWAQREAAKCFKSDWGSLGHSMGRMHNNILVYANTSSYTGINKSETNWQS